MLNHRAWQLMWVFVEKFSIILVSVITFFIYARILGPEELGVGLFALAIGQGIGVLYMAFLEDPLVRQPDIQPSHYDSAFWGGLVISSATAVVVMLVCLLTSDDVSFLWLMAISVLHIPLLTISRIYTADLRRKGKFASLAKRTMGGKVLGGAVGLLLAWQGFGGVAIIAQSVIMTLAGLLIMMLGSELRFGRDFRKPVFLQLLSIGWPLALRGASWDVMERGITIILGMTAGSSAVGVFGLARRLIDMPRSAIYGGLISYALPAFSRSQNDLPKLQGMICFATLTTVFMVLPMFVGLAMVAPFLIPSIFGEEWRPAVPLLQVLAIVAAVGSTLLYVGPALTAIARNKMTLASELIGTTAALTLVFVAGDKWGAAAAATGFIAHQLITFPTRLICLKIALQIPPRRWLEAIYRSVIASLCMAAAIYLVIAQVQLSHPLALSLAIILVGAFSYLSIYTLLHRSWCSDLKGFFSKS